jgi:hypothetical protein
MYLTSSAEHIWRANGGQQPRMDLSSCMNQLQHTKNQKKDVVENVDSSIRF